MTTTSKIVLSIVAVGLLLALANNLSESDSHVSLTQNCHSSYSGCLRADASDYDCSGGSGNGPYYTGRVRVIGHDVFGLDRDGDGWGCE